MKSNILKLKEIVSNSVSVSDVMRAYGYKYNNTTKRKLFHKLVVENCIDISHFIGKSTVITSSERWKDDTFILTSAEASNNMIEFLSKFNLDAKGQNRRTAKRHIERLNVDISHWKTYSLSGVIAHYSKIVIPLDEIISGKHPTYKTCSLKHRLYKEGLKENKCEECGITDWNNKPLIMQLDHIDGNSKNHNLINLKILCPNCHSQTSTYAGRNKK